MKRSEHIIDLPPKGAVCVERKCNRKATEVRLTNELILMQDGTIHEGVEWVCKDHKET